MSGASNIPAGFDAPTGDEERPEALNFTLVVVSPSVGVSGPLTFAHLPATTSVKELKAKIRDALPSKPADENQRLIHRGRMLAREMETMVEIFGRETLGNPESQTLHLVLRPTGPDPPLTRPLTPLVGSQQIPNPLSNTLQARPQSTPNIPNHGLQTQLPLPGFQQVTQHQLLHQTDHLQNMMAQRLQQLHQETIRLQQDMMSIEQRTRALAAGNQTLFTSQQPTTGQTPPMIGLQNQFQVPNGGFRTPPMPTPVQNLINQQQRDRAAEGRQGAQDSAAVPNITRITQPGSGRASPNLFRPDHSTTHTREGVGPNGERWQITVNETTTTIPVQQGAPHPHPHHHHHHHQGFQGSNPILDNLQAILRNADRGVLNPQPTPASTPPVTGTIQAMPSSLPNPAATGQNQSLSGPLPTANHSSTPPSLVPNQPPSVPIANTAVQPTFATNPTNNVEPMVYILSSPQGPRALLMSNSDTFYTPRQWSMRRRRETPATGQGGADGQAAGRLPALGEFLRNDRNPDRRRVRQDRFGNAQAQRPDHPVEVVVGHANANQGAGALAAQIGPLIWLFVRLAGFVWFFTAGNHSWLRFFMVSALAFGIFIVNTGLLNGVFEQLWGPIRRHVETLIPLAGPDAALVPAANARIPQQPEAAAAPAEPRRGRRRRPGELDEAEVAARLIERHRQANAGWLRVHIRRAEHAALLFLASLVPGVGERHIAAREAEANAAEAERQRLIDEAAAAENAEAANEQTSEGDVTGEPQEPHPQEPESAAPPPVIEV